MPFDSTEQLPEPDGLRRLRRLKVVVEGVPDRKFVMSRWRADDAGCGTVGCAMGWAAMDEELQRDGLRHGPDDVAPTFGRQEGFLAGAKFFDVPLIEAVRLFCPDRYVDGRAPFAQTATRAEFLRRLDGVIAEKEAAWLAEVAAR